MNLVKNSLAAGITALGMAYSGAARAQELPPMDEEVFNACAVDAVIRAADAPLAMNDNLMVEGPDFVDLNGTRLTLNPDLSVSGSGKHADDAVRAFIACYSDPNLTL